MIKPTIEEIKAYCDERNNNVSPEQFYNFYESKDWFVGKNKMKNWKACIGTWEQKDGKRVESNWVADKWKQARNMLKKTQITDEYIDYHSQTLINKNIDQKLFDSVMNELMIDPYKTKLTIDEIDNLYLEKVNDFKKVGFKFLDITTNSKGENKRKSEFMLKFWIFAQKHFTKDIDKFKKEVKYSERSLFQQDCIDEYIKGRMENIEEKEPEWMQ